MKTGNPRHRLLLVSFNSCHESDFLAALRRVTLQQPQLLFELWFLSTETAVDFLEVLNTLDRIRSGFFFRGAPCTLGEHMVSCSSLLQSGAATSQVTFRASGTFSVAANSPREGELREYRAGSVLLVYGAGHLLPAEVLCVVSWCFLRISAETWWTAPLQSGSAKK